MAKSKYLVIADKLRSTCLELHEGTQLPSEQKLSASLEASPMTIRRALELLQEEGIVTKFPGRGTFVHRGIITKNSSLTSFTEDMYMRGMTPGTRVIAVDETLPVENVVRDLSLGQTEHVLQIERLRLADNEPICLELAHIPQRYAKLLAGSDFTSLHRELTTAGAAPAAATRRVRAAITTDRQASLLGIPPVSPVLNIVQVFFDCHARPVQRADSWFRADRYEMYSRVTRDNDKRTI